MESDRRRRRRHVEYETGRVVRDACYILVGVLFVALFLDLVGMVISWVNGAQDPRSFFIIPLGDWVEDRLAAALFWATE